MAGVLIYESALKNYSSLVIADDKEYAAMRTAIRENISNKILWERKNVSLKQIENSRKTKDNLVRRLNEGEKVDLEKELSIYFS